MSIFALSDSTTILPVIHGSGDFALEVRRRILGGDYDCIALPLPPDFEGGVESAVDQLPQIHIIAQREGGVYADPSAWTYVPVEPCQPVVSAVRTAIEQDIPRAYIDLEVEPFEEQSITLPDPYALKEVSLERFATAVLAGLTPPPEGGQQSARIRWMAYQLHLLELDYERILCVVSIADWPWLRDAFTHRLDYPESEAVPWAPDIFRVDPDSLFFVTGELPFITALYEHRRAEMLPDESLAIDGVKALLLEARTEWIRAHDLQTHWLTPQTLSVYLKYVRNLTLFDRRMSPDLYTLGLAGKQIGGDAFAVALVETARTYPPQRIPSPNLENDPDIRIGMGRADFPTGESPIKNRLKGVPTEWRTLPLRPSPPPEKKRQWRMQWDPFRQCSHSPEDTRIESFNSHVREQARQLIGQDLARSEKFTTSLKDGLDIRETLRNWHTGDIYVKELPPSRGDVEIVVFLFDSPCDPEKYPWKATWYAEHEEESTLCFFATNFAENIIGPGIGQANYGGCSLLFPPRPIPDIWTDPRFEYAKTPQEHLLAAALYHSRERRVVLVAPHGPLPRWRRIARRYGKQIVTLPLRRFSLQTLDRLRRFHVLNGRDVRSYAARYIRDFR